ncbi:Sister chromatid cohesion protein DCC1 [Rhizophlyctis rosea]|uniref:Sister chromatid cohesion protein DCC1 n=1 Tax=Rhizophlyctis rosea TaxID=64517 RepID=A0AAD5X4G6_9FUNG|nr:Sister chromatid cohesion protein DCC1 [Rhizophlyctis rosea]
MTDSHTILYFADDFDPRQYRLLELPKELAALLDTPQPRTVVGNKQPSCFVVRGQESDEATLHTENKTYTVRDVQTSNTLLLAKPSNRHPTDFATEIAADPSIVTELQNSDSETSSILPAWVDTAHVYEVQDCISNYLELTLTQPRVGKLREILEPCLYAGPKEEARVDQKLLYTTESLHELVQASNEELLQGLKEVEALEIDGHWRLLDPAYQETVLRLLIVSAIADDIPLSHMTLEDAARLLNDADDDDGIPKSVSMHVLIAFADKDGENEQTYAISSSKVCRFLGQQLLANSTRHSQSLTSFLQSWSENVPEPFEVEIDMLKGTALIHNDELPRTIQYFPKSTLPSEAKQRFERLFDVKRKWSYDELLPYIDDLAPDKKKLDALLMKYARMSKSANTMFYTSRFSTMK